MANQIRVFGLRQINPSGKSLLIFRSGVKPRNQKYSAFAVGQISAITTAVPCPQEGRFAIVTDVGCGMRWTLWRQVLFSRRTKTPRRTAKSCGPGAAMLALSLVEFFLEATVTTSPLHRG